MYNSLRDKIKYFLLLAAGIAIFISCEKETESLHTTYLQNYRLLASYSTEQVKGNLLLASLLYPDFDTLLPGSIYGVDIYKVIYKIHLLGEEILASGLACLPDGEDYFPILSFQNGTNTCHFNAPSENANDEFYGLIAMMAGNGYIVTIPDYIGFGESDHILHPYMHRESSNDAIIGFLLATKEMLSMNHIQSQHNGELYLMGYSQGGWATLSALNELETFPIAGLEPKAAVCGAGAYDLMEMARYIFRQQTYPTPFYLPFFIESRHQLGLLNEDLSLYFREPYATNIPQLFEGDLCNREINEAFTSTVGDLLTPQLLGDFEEGNNFQALREELSQNSIPSWTSRSKLRFYHSTGDKSIPYSQTEDCYQKMLQSGILAEDVTLMIVQADSLDHSDAVIPWGIDAISWLQSIQP